MENQQNDPDAMDIDLDSSQQTPNIEEIHTLPNYNTKKISKMIESTIAAPTTLDELFQEYKAFSLLKKKDDMSNS